MKKSKSKILKIKKGLFFKSDFKKLPNNVVIYIEKGFVMYEDNKNGISKK